MSELDVIATTETCKELSRESAELLKVLINSKGYAKCYNGAYYICCCEEDEKYIDEKGEEVEKGSPKYKHTVHRIYRKNPQTRNWEMGGYVEYVENLDRSNPKYTCWIDGDAMVFGDAQVCDNAQVYDNAILCGSSIIGGNTEVCGNICINFPKEDIFIINRDTGEVFSGNNCIETRKDLINYRSLEQSTQKKDESEQINQIFTQELQQQRRTIQRSNDKLKPIQLKEGNSKDEHLLEKQEQVEKAGEEIKFQVLQQENKRLQQENERLQQEIKSLQARRKKAEEMGRTLLANIENLREENKRLKKQLADASSATRGVEEKTQPECKVGNGSK